MSTLKSKVVLPDIDLSPFDDLMISPNQLSSSEHWGEQRMLNPDSLDIPTQMQRDAIVSHVVQIATHFNPKYFGSLTVARFTVGDQTYQWVVDGGQRLTAVNLRNKILRDAAQKLDQLIRLVPCVIINVAGKKEAADIFLWIDKYRKRIAFEERLKAGLVARTQQYVLANQYYNRFEKAGASLAAREKVFKIVNNPKLRKPFDAILDDIVFPLCLMTNGRPIHTQVMDGMINLQARLELRGHSLCETKVRTKILDMGPDALADQCRAVASATQNSNKRPEVYATAMARKLKIKSEMYGD